MPRTNYNYFRDYDPGIGRYVQSDPIGLDGGLNTYGYVGSTPLLRIDARGLAATGTVGAGCSIFVVGIGVNGQTGFIGGSDSKLCRVTQVCVRFGGGAYLGCGIGVGMGLNRGDTGAAGGFGIGLGGDVGLGAGASGSAQVGSGSASIGRGAIGLGWGLNVGVDFCFTMVKCDECQK